MCARALRTWHAVLVVDRQFREPRTAALYDRFCEGRPDFEFYLPFVMQANKVLDVGCGSGRLLHLAREAGHTGHLCGIDPAGAMLEVARARSDIEWLSGDLASAHWNQEFDLVVMTGHAFQVLLDDDEIRAALAAVYRALTDDGFFAFETRNPSVRTWETWTPANAMEILSDTGSVVHMEHQFDTPVDPRFVSFTTSFASPDWDAPVLSRSTLRFLTVSELRSFLSAAHLKVIGRFGDWDRRPYTDASPEIITVVSRV